jgi:hypothetical protein
VGAARRHCSLRRRRCTTACITGCITGHTGALAVAAVLTDTVLAVGTACDVMWFTVTVLAVGTACDVVHRYLHPHGAQLQLTHRLLTHRTERSEDSERYIKPAGVGPQQQQQQLQASTARHYPEGVTEASTGQGCDG